MGYSLRVLDGRFSARAFLSAADERFPDEAEGFEKDGPGTVYEPQRHALVAEAFVEQRHDYGPPELVEVESAFHAGVFSVLSPSAQDFSKDHPA